MVESIALEDDDRGVEVLVARVRPVRSRRGRCSRCERRCRGYDQGAGRRWRALDVGTVKAYLEADAPRVACPAHGVVVAGVPLARPGARHTTGFKDMCAWLAAHTAGSVATTPPLVLHRRDTGLAAMVVPGMAAKGGYDVVWTVETKGTPLPDRGRRP